MEPKDELDRIIDGALAAYSTAEPPAGLEERVLSRIRAAETLRRRAIARALTLAAVAAAVLVVIVTSTPRAAAPKADHIARVETPAPAPTAAEKQRVVRKRPAQVARIAADTFAETGAIPSAVAGDCGGARTRCVCGP